MEGTSTVLRDEWGNPEGQVRYRWEITGREIQYCLRNVGELMERGRVGENSKTAPLNGTRVRHPKAVPFAAFALPAIFREQHRCDASLESNWYGMLAAAMRAKRLIAGNYQDTSRLSPGIYRMHRYCSAREDRRSGAIVDSWRSRLLCADVGGRRARVGEASCEVQKAAAPPSGTAATKAGL